MFSKIEFKSCALFGTHIKRTVLSTADVEASYSNRHAKQRTYQERLTTTLALYSARTETHMSNEIASSFALYSAHTENVHFT